MTRPLCPMCGTDRVCRIVPGTPTADEWEMIRRYQAVLGSAGDVNDWFCSECFHQWRDERETHR